MSQVNSYDRESYTTNGVAKSFSFGWNVNSKDDVKIQFVNAKGEIVNSAKFIDANDDEYTTSTYNFTVELNRQGGQIVFVDTPAEDQYLIIYRQTPLVYENSFKTATAFPAAAIDAAYRKIWLAIQEISADSLYNTLRLTPDQRGTVLDAFEEGDNNSLIYYDSVGNKLTYTNFKVQDIENALVLTGQIPSIASDASEALNKANNAITIANNAKAEAQLARQDASNAMQAVNGKQDQLVSGVNIKTINGNSLLGAGDLTVTASVEWGNISGDINDQTDLKNALDAKANTTDIGDATLSIQKNGTTIDTFTANATVDKTINITVPTQASDVGALPDSTKYGASLSLTINSSTYVITAQLKDQDGNSLGSAQTIDLPLESVVVNGSYDDATKSLILTLENGNTITIPVADLISGLQEELVSGTNIKTINGNSILGAGNLQVSGFLPYEAGWTTNSTTKAFCDDIAADSSAVVGNAYLGEVTINDMPAGIANAEIKVYILDGTNASNKVIQLELTSGNVAPYKWIYTYWNGGSDVSGWKTWQEPLVSGTNIKTVNSTSLLGSGDITIDGLPTQTGQGGKYLTTDGSTASWATVDALPTQTGNSGKLLTTNGTSASWTEIKTINSGSLVGSGNIDVLVNEATPASSLGVGYTTINTTYNDSINIGNASQVLANNAIALGAFASAEGQDSIAIYSSTGTAHRARTTHTGNIAIGYNALAINAAYTIAIGYNAYAQGANSIQLGTGQVALQNTFQVWTYPMLNKTSGLIPSARLADQTNATQGQALILDANLDGQWTTIATVATSGSYNDLFNKPTIPAAQVNADWNANSGVAEILNKPTLGTMAAEDAADYTPTSSLASVATTGDYDDLLNKPTIPTVNDATLTIQKNGTNVATFTANASSAVTANISVPTDTNDLTNGAGYITGITSSDVTAALGYTPVDSSSLATVATTGAYSDLSGTPTIPTVNNPTITITQGGVTKGSFTLNQASGDTIALDTGGGSALPDPTGHTGELLTNDGINASWTSVIDCGTMS